MSVYNKYEPVIGLEVHIQLLTKSKAYSSDSTEFGAMPNTNVSVITLGHPGTLPKTNKKVIEFAVRLGIACNSSITKENQYARKNYFYPDLPKGYQITQDKTPICTGGYITIKNSDGSEKKINLTRIHMEEDAGKSMHDQDPYDTLIDLNRAGVPLLEMVSEPEIRSGEEAYKYLTEVRKLVRYLDICDGNMEEGSLRCDANISVRIKGTEKFGKRTEVKNMNSIRNVQKAIDHEIKRQIDLLEEGQTFEQETRSFDATTGTTFSLRSKEFAHDYRYFPEPDLQPVLIEQDYINEVKKSLPPLPDQLFKKYTNEFGLSEYDAGVLTDDRDFALFFEKVVSEFDDKKIAANLMMGFVKSYLNEKAIHISQFPITPKKLVEYLTITREQYIPPSSGVVNILPELAMYPQKSVNDIIKEKNLSVIRGVDSIMKFAEQAVLKYPEKVLEYKMGKKGLIGLFMGEVMKLSKGKADPKIANQIVKEMLDKS